MREPRVRCAYDLSRCSTGADLGFGGVKIGGLTRPLYQDKIRLGYGVLGTTLLEDPPTLDPCVSGRIPCQELKWGLRIDGRGAAYTYSILVQCVYLIIIISIIILGYHWTISPKYIQYKDLRI